MFPYAATVGCNQSPVTNKKGSIGNECLHTYFMGTMTREIVQAWPVWGSWGVTEIMLSNVGQFVNHAPRFGAVAFCDSH